MKFVLQPSRLLLGILAGWNNRQQQDFIEYLRTENQVLKEKLGKGRILLSDDQRRSSPPALGPVFAVPMVGGPHHHCRCCGGTSNRAFSIR